MKKLPLTVAVICFLLAIAVFVFAEGARAVYSGILFAVLGATAIWSAKRKAKKNAP